ncbi:MAG: HAMP domain-containing histidine kinase [Actinobacteria bacterium]|nr:HAMP domain-containing histidine kinase [Actinomycetota bacterium]
MRSLRARATLVTIAVAVIAVIVTGLISLQLARSSVNQDARDQLSAQADILARMPRLATAAELAEKASLALGGTQVALVQPDGTAEGDAADYIDAAILRKLAAGESVSTVRRGDPGMVLIEARPVAGGGAVVLALPLASIDRALGQATGRILVALGIGLGVAIIGGWLLASWLSRPLTNTAAAARRLAAGERGVRMPDSPTSEMADVTDALGALDSALAASESRQREFLLSISHELRTPLTAVRGYAEAMADGLIGPEDVTAVGGTLVSETERLDQFVGDLLELARLEADDFSITVSTVELAPLLEEVASAWAGRAAVLGVGVGVSTSSTGGGSTGGGSTIGTVDTDPRRLRQVIDGLVENALRAGGSVQLRGSDGVVEVLDDGPGLEESDLSTAFERGALRARYRDIRPVGTGLGLSIAARLVDRLGGTISVANRPEGGAVFRVDFRTPTAPSAHDR